MAVELIPRGLPKPWSFAVTRDGRIFFVNDESRTTTWLHPVTAEPVCTGNVTLPDLPAGWERSVNLDCVPFYIDHNRKETTFVHPITQLSSIQYGPPKSVSQQPYLNSSSANSNSIYNTSSELRKSQKKKGQHIRSPVIKRDSRSTVTMEGWLYKLEGGALKQWRKRWFVLADFCLFVYKGPDEEKVLGSILLPSYKINPCTSEDKTSRKFAFKAEHHNMKTYYFAADSKESMGQWMNVMSLASIMQKSLSPGICGGSANPKVSFSNDDEDSGFTSYKSRRYGSTQDPNSTLNSSFASEQLNLQYNYRDVSRDNFSDSSHITGRSSENEYLGSGDKYPGHYGSSLSRAYSASPRESEVSTKGRQPLYANAPPKPKRTGQKDPYAIAPNERYDTARLEYTEEIYDERGHKHTPKLSSRQNYDISCPRLYNEQNKEYFTTEHHAKLANDSVQQVKPVNSDNSYARNTHKQQHQHKDATPLRPHSADFLEHDSYNDPFNAPVIYRHKSSSRNKANQPPRPKSSLERYDPHKYSDNDAWMRQEKDYWYREQVSSPLPMHCHADNSFEQQSVGYYSSHNISTDDHHYKISINEQHRRNSDISTDRQKQYTGTPFTKDSQNPKSSRIRDRPASTGCQLEDSSILVDGADDSKNHQREVSMKRLLEWKQRMLQSPLARKYPQRTSGGQYEDNSIPPPRPPLPEEYQQRVLQELENHEAQLRLREMQCKEKSYDEPSVTNAEIHSDRGQLKQINDKNDSTMLLQHISKKEGEKDERNACSPSRSQDHRRPSSSLGRLNSSYSSDEEEDKTKDCKRTRRQSQICRPKRSSIDKSSTNRNTVMKTNVSPSPDYVNITMLNDIHGKATCDAFTSSSKMKSIPAEEDLRNLASSKENLKMETYANETQDSNLYSTKYFASPDSVDTSFASNDGEENDEKEDFYIRKEDYYKASQLFYAKPQGSKRDKPSVKNTESSDQLGSICINENAKTDKSSTNLSKTQKSEETYDSRYWSNAERRSRTNWQLDKDVGLPLPPYPGSARMKDARQKKMQLRSNSLPSVQQQDLPEDVLRSDKSEHMPKPKKVSPDIANSGEKNPRTENILFHTSSIRHMEEKAKSIELPSTPSKSCSFEEMRTFLQRQKEAPPPNIVQSRIKHFEQTSPSVQTPGEIRKRLSGNDKPTKEQASKNVIASKSETEITFEDSVNQVIDETKISVHRRQLCSDSETVFHNDSTNDNESNDDILTIKSAPIVLSPLSSVLADLRRTADTGREKTKTNKDESSIDEIIITKGALRLSMVEDQTLTELDEPCKVEEEVYLPMKGKNAEEAVYVAMSDSKESLLASHSITKEQLEKPPLTEDEPLYNEPISPPPSFLHDVYGKHKSRHSHFQFESSSSGHSSENIYEKPNYFDDLSTNSCIKNRSFKSMYSENRPISSYVKISKEQENDFEIKTDSMDKGENFPVTLTYTAGSLVSEKTLEQDEFIDCDIPSQLNDSIPDLLQVKDSDASDADDEASRDFDTPKNLSLPPYQTAILLGEQSSIDDHASIDDDHNLQTVFPFKSSNHCQPLKMLELSNNNFHRTLKKESEIENRNMEQDSLFELSSSLPNYQTLNEEQRFTEFLYDMIPLKAMESHQSGNYLHCKEENESQLRVANENKKLGRKTSLPVIINRKIIEGNLEKSEQRICDLPNISKLSKVSKSENEVQNVGLNTNSEITSSFSKATTAIEAKTISLCDVKADYSMNTTSYSSLAPDVVPADDRDEISHNAKISSKTNRSPSSAPYYYSDLLTETDGSKLGRLPVIDKFCVSRSNHNVLNNVRDVSPSNSNKSDVGRKVNKICENNRILSPNRFSSSESFTNSMQFSLSSDITQMAEQDIRSSLQHLLIPESTKFRDAEKNKYEAGHTLEKTRSTASTLQRLKKRAATPDFSRNHEHHYENLDSTWAVTVKRLSRSLEELLDTDEGLQNQNCWHSHQFSLEKNEEPFYENIGFSALKSETCNSFDDAAKDRDLIASPQTAPAKHTVFDNDQLNYSNNIKTPNHFNQIKHTESKQDLTDARSPLDSYSDNHDSDGYLDQNILRSASKRHFLARFTNEKYVSQLTRNQTSSDSIASSTGPDCFLAESRRSNDGSGEVSDRGREKKSEGIEVSNLEGLSSTYRQKSHYKLVEKPISKAQNNLGHHSLREHDFFDSSSDSSASLRPENEGIAHQKKHYTSNSKADTCKNKTGVFRMSKEDPNMSDSEIHVRTPSRLKKLVHQSEGLTSRGKRLSISAGDLLGKTHEELVLLLIQLRRNQSCIAKKRQQCHIQLESEIYLNERESSREEHMKKCEEINHQMLELVKQYEMTQPLINLVDNMVKLGSLYGPERKTTNSHMESVSENISLPCMQLLELSKQLRNRQLTCKGGSASKTFNEDSLEERLQQLYHLDRTLHDEFLNFTSLQQDREILETTLEGVRKKVSEFRDNAVDMGRLYKQQRMIEKELSKVIRLLMQSIQKLERVVGENSSLEQEIVCLKQQIHQFLQCNKDVEGTPQEKAEIETELCRVEQIIEELASHRRNINNTIEKAKVESKHKVLSSEVRASPTGVAGSVPLPIRKKHQSSYMETDLDTMECKDLSGHGVSTMELDGNDIPLYANAGEIGSPTQEFGPDGTLLSTSVQLPLDDNYDPQDINEADDRMKMFYGIIPKDKPSEIKTVRIVKRESERRNRVRDKKKVTYDDNSLVWVVEEPEIFLYEEDEVEEEVERLRQTLLLPGLYNRPTSLFTPQQEMALSAHERLFGPTSVFTGIEEGKLNSDRDMASDSLSPTRRPKRRHYTISGFSYNPLFKGGLRSCDDVDMERCLRTANTPDIVRSTIKKSDVFDDKIIDRELGLPQKINIPERYIESEPEQLSATERLKRSLKAETIRRMLSETTTYEDVADKQEPTDLLKKKVDEEKKRRAHLLALNHALAREVMERSKIVAANVTSPESPYSLP